MKEQKRYWLGSAPICDICKITTMKTFIDGGTKVGPWASMCPDCFEEHGTSLGPGKGQKYALQEDNRWLKVGG